MAHDFLLLPGLWLGEGTIRFSASPETIKFYTRWETSPIDEGLLSTQWVEMQGNDEKLANHFSLSDIIDGTFSIELENNLVGTVRGKGVKDATTIAWEFRGNPGFEGYEVYTLQPNGDYKFHAEYASTEQFRTIIDGKIWKKAL